MRPGILGAAALLAFCCASLPAPAEGADSVELWGEASVRYRPIKPLRITFSQGVRWADRLDYVESVLPELSLQYKFNDWFRLGGGYRYTAQQRPPRWDNEWRDRHRIYVDARSGVELGPVELGVRSRLQHVWREQKNDTVRRPTWRNRLGAEVEVVDDVKPFTAFELSTPFAWSDDDVSPRLHLAEWRFTLGVTFDITGEHRLEPFYHFERSVGVDPVERTHVIGLAYRFDIPR